MFYLSKMKRLIGILSFLFLVTFEPLIAQQSGNLWTRVLGDTALAEQGQAITVLPSGNLLLVATANRQSGGGADALLYRLNPEGEVLDSAFFGTADNDYPAGILFLNGDTVLVAGSTSFSGAPSRGFLACIDTLGSVRWLKYYGDPNLGSGLKSVIADTDGLLLTGRRGGPGGSGVRAFIFKVNFQGDSLWGFNSPWNANEVGHSAVRTGTGFWIALDRQDTSGIYQPYIIKVDSTGQLQDSRAVSSQLNSGAQALLRCRNGDLLLVGESYPTLQEPQFDVLMVRFDSAGNELWRKYHGEEEGDAGFSVLEHDDKNFTVVGYGYNPANNSTDLLMLHCDSMGNELRRSYAGGNGIDQGYSASLLPDGSFLATGFLSRGFDSQALLVRERWPGPNTGIFWKEPSGSSKLIAYPNPLTAGSPLLMEIPSGRWQILFYTVSGQKMWSQYLITDTGQTTIRPEVEPGHYFMILRSGKNGDIRSGFLNVTP